MRTKLLQTASSRLRRQKRGLRRANPIQIYAFQAALVCVSLVFLAIILNIQRTLDVHLEERHSMTKELVRSKNSSTLNSHQTRFLVVLPLGGGQGLGNWINGLLAAHLMAEEFDRVVCVSTANNDFHMGFRHKYYANECAQFHTGIIMENKISSTSWLRPDECSLAERLASNETILYFRGNTYPRWPKVPSNFFDKHYEPKEILLSILPWKQGIPPEVVVHLRHGDRAVETRKGLDKTTLQALARALPPSTFLVTNRVAWYDYFSKHGWSSPGWDVVTHSAKQNIDWGGREDKTNLTAAEEHSLNQLIRDRRTQTLRMLSDWYTILRAKLVYHTHSDFSQSAIHWMGMESKKINGVKDDRETLDLLDESWYLEGDTPKLSERTISRVEGKVQCFRIEPRPSAWHHVGRKKQDKRSDKGNMPRA